MKLKLPSIFSDHLVLQRGARVPIWGRAEPGDEITIVIAGVTATTSVYPDGTWNLEFDLREAGAESFEIAISGAKSGAVTIRDVVIGEVWLASGQSNMEWPLDRSLGGAEEIAHSGGLGIREFQVDRTSSDTPQDDVSGRWRVAGPETAANFSAVAFHFAKNLERELKCPIGVVHSSWGGSRLEAWLAPDTLNAQEQKLAAIEQQRLAESAVERQKYVENYRTWEERFGRQDPGSPHPEEFAAPGVEDSGWKKVVLPGKLAEQELPDSGVTWLRRKVTIPPAFAFREMHIHIDTLREFERFYIDGKLVRETTTESPQQVRGGSRAFHIPSPLPLGECTWAIRLFSPAGGAEISGGSFKIEGEIGVDGEWLAKNEAELPPISNEAKAALPQPPQSPPAPSGIPGMLYNGMIAPLVPFSLAGVIWYQGESNTGETETPLYADGFHRMVEDWRRRFQRAELPFYFCQLPNFDAKTNEFPRQRWPEFREVQAAALALPHVGMAVTIDIGDALDIHPCNKREVGNRLARLALARTYGRKVAAESPMFARMKIEGRRVRLLFLNAENGLIAPQLPDTHVIRYKPDFSPTTEPLLPPFAGTPVHGVAICGEDRQWHWAHAEVENDTVVAWSDAVPNPVAIRYAWSNNPTCNLFSADGLPVAPFRTDDFALE